MKAFLSRKKASLVSEVGKLEFLAALEGIPAVVFSIEVSGAAILLNLWIERW